MATKPDNKNEEAELSRQQLLAALQECREQLARAEAMLVKSKQDNQPAE